MTRYLLRRIFASVWALLAISVIVFGMLNLTGDPTVLYVNPGETTREDYEILRHALGFDRPVHVRYFKWISRSVRGDFGESVRHREPALPLVLRRAPASLQLAGAAFGFALLFGLSLGLVSGLRRGSWIDRTTMVVALSGLSTPNFLLGLVLILFFGVQLGWLPVFGGGTPKHLILPAITLGAYTTAVLARLARSCILEVIHLDYIRTARAKGLEPWRVLYRHALKNAAISIATILGLRFAVLLSGSIVVETVFAYPGMGLLAVRSVLGRDVPVVMAFALLFAATVITINLLVDVTYTYLDPRVRYD